MVRKRLIPGLTAVSMLMGAFSMSANAQSSLPSYLFDNEKGLVSSQGCALSVTADTDFRVVFNSSEPNRNYENVRRRPNQTVVGKLINYSLVKTIDGIADENFQNIEVAGVSVREGMRVDAPLSQKAQRGDKGYMFKDSLKSLKDYVIELTAAVDLTSGAKLAKLPNTEYAVDGAFLQAAMLGDSFVNYQCGENLYTAFDVHVAESEKAIVRILISKDDSRIFKNIRVFTEEEAEQAIAERLEEAKQQGENSRQSGSNSGNQQGSRNDDGPTDDELNDREVGPNNIAVSPIIADNFYQYVVCLADNGSRLNVRSADGKDVLFTLANGSRIKMAQSVSGNNSDTVQIQDVITSKVGWVSSEYVKQASLCTTMESELPASRNTLSYTGDKIAIGTYQVCTQSGDPLTVYDTNFNQLDRAYYLNSGENAKVVDGLLVNNPNKAGYQYVKVTTESNYTRYVAKDFLTQNTCATASSDEGGGGRSADGYIFPTFTTSGFSYVAANKRPNWGKRSKFHPDTSDHRDWGMSGYRSNWGIYGASRGGGSRGHAATDIYQPWGQARPTPTRNYPYDYFGGKFRAMHNGKVVRGSTYFYEGTYYIVVLNNDNTVSRYGEIFGTTTYKNRNVKTGEVLGHIKWVGTKSVAPMLHFENYNPGNADVRNGNLAGNKKVNGRNTQRSKHLFDRTTFMKDLEQKTFY